MAWYSKVHWDNVRDHAKFRRDRSNRCDLTVFKMAAVRHLGF